MRSGGLLQFDTLQDSFSHAAEGPFGRAEYLQDAAALLMELIPGDTVGWNLVDRASRTAEIAAFPRGHLNDQKVSLRLAAVMDDHPAVIKYLGDPSVGNWIPRRLSDVVTMSQLRSTRAYVELLHPVGADHQLTIPTANPTPDSGRAWAINRSGRDFTDRELEVSIRLQPILVILERGAAHPPADTSGDEAAERLRLTTRERQILQQVADGLTADEIGALLRISPRTVRKHLENAYEKLGQHDRLRAVQRARVLALVV
jgi:DNA-binding CsgD family transcriptional regulator